MREKDMEEIDNTLRECYITDMTKPEITKFERARIIKKFMIDNQLSHGDICKRFNIKKSTLTGWLKWLDMKKSQYKSLKNKGYSETDITNMLKCKNYSKEGQFIIAIRTVERIINGNSFRYSTLTDDDLEEVRQLRNKLNLILYKNDR